ncbi:MAG: type IV toxin-antitoxin system AbiEi family antitoxin [Prevotella sp.]
MGVGFEISDIQHWVEEQMIRGRYMFTKQDVLNLGLPIKEVCVKRSLQRLEAKGTIMSPWQNFYVVVATEYRLKGVVPPSSYMDRLMAFLGRGYYVSHLSAAAFNGASHQMAMVFQTMVNGGPIRSGVKNGTKLEFTLRQNLPLEFAHKVLRWSLIHSRHILYCTSS